MKATAFLSFLATIVILATSADIEDETAPREMQEKGYVHSSHHNNLVYLPETKAPRLEVSKKTPPIEVSKKTPVFVEKKVPVVQEKKFFQESSHKKHHKKH